MLRICVYNPVYTLYTAKQGSVYAKIDPFMKRVYGSKIDPKRG